MNKLKLIFDMLNLTFNDLGCRKQGNNFYRYCDRRLIVFNFQGSRSGKHFYVNFGSKEIVEPNSQGKATPKELKSVDRFARIDMFSDTNGWLYAMCDVERDILTRKITESLRATLDHSKGSSEDGGV